MQNSFLCHFHTTFCKIMSYAVIAAVVKPVKRWKRKRSYWNCSREPIRTRMALCSGVNRVYTLSTRPITSTVSLWHTLGSHPQLIAYWHRFHYMSKRCPDNSSHKPLPSLMFHRFFFLSILMWLCEQNVASDVKKVLSHKTPSCSLLWKTPAYV